MLWIHSQGLTAAQCAQQDIGSVVTRGRPLKLELGAGTLQARFPDNLDGDDQKHHSPATDNPAIVSNRYGQGHAMIMAFDLPATLMQEPSLPDAWQAIIEATFDELLPELPETYASGALVVARTTVANLGQAADLQVITTLPPDAQVISTRNRPLRSTAQAVKRYGTSISALAKART